MGFRVSVLLAVAASATGCYVQSAEDRAPVRGEQAARPPAQDVGECKVTLSKGCFDGHVVSKQEFFVEGKAFHNADDLATRFRELLTVQGDGADLTDYALELETPLDNLGYAAGFEYDLMGSVSRSGKIGPDGDFHVNELAEGQYELRVQKSVKFRAKRTVEQPVAADDQAQADDAQRDDPATDSGAADGTADDGAADGTSGADGGSEQATRKVEIAKSFCATIYADSTIDVRHGVRGNDNFKDFRLYVTDSDCTGKSHGTTLTLDP
jgi:hypothetical protein